MEIYDIVFNYEYYKEKDIVEYEVGFLFPDYFSENHEKKTHASLNHQLGIINYLLVSYIRKGDVEYKTIALKLLNTIGKQSNNWIRDNNDLWYQVDENSLYLGTDYKLLTLEDLLYTQNYFILSSEKKVRKLQN